MAGLRAFTKYFGGFVLAAAALGLLTFAQDGAPKRGRKYKAPPPTTHMVVTVTRATTGKPVENASVIFHPIEDGKSAGNMELKTNDDGQTTLDLLEIGSTVRVQVLKDGFQTFGEDFKIDKDQMAIAVKLHRPAEQYSIYKNHKGQDTSKDATEESVTPDGQNNSNDAKPNDAKPNDAKPNDAKPKDDAASGAEAEPQKNAPRQPSQPETKPQPSTTPQ